MNILKFFKGTKVNYNKGLGVPDLPLSVYKGNQPIKSVDFKKIVNEFFLPKVKEIGFKGKDFTYSKEREGYTEIINFWTYKTGGAIQVDLLIKFENIDYLDREIDVKASKNLKTNDCEFQKRLSPLINLSKQDTWFWIFNESYEENIKLVKDIWQVFEECGVNYFKRFENLGNYIKDINSKNYLEFPDFFLNRLYGRGEAGILFFLFNYWSRIGVVEKALEFARVGLKEMTSSEYDNYRKEFNEYIIDNFNKKSPAANTAYK